MNLGATNGDVHAIDIALSDPANTNLEVEGLATRTGINPVKQYLGTPASLGIGVTCVSGVCKDSTTAFGSAATDIEIFTNDNDSIACGSLTKFDEINITLNTPSSKNIRATFEFSTGGTNGYNTFTPNDDTSGFKKSGTIRFDGDNLTGWSTATVTEATNGGLTDSTTYYFVKITRKRNIIVTPPIENTIKVTSFGSEFEWDRLGNVEINTVAVTDGITAPTEVSGFAIMYVDVADGDLKVKFSDGTVATIATD